VAVVVGHTARVLPEQGVLVAAVTAEHPAGVMVIQVQQIRAVAAVEDLRLLLHQPAAQAAQV
jgi:hypothetical protein